MVIGFEFAPPGKHQPHEWDRQRDQKPAEFIAIGLQFIQHQAGILAPFLDDAFVQPIDPGDVHLGPVAIALAQHCFKNANLGIDLCPARIGGRKPVVFLFKFGDLLLDLRFIGRSTARPVDKACSEISRHSQAHHLKHREHRKHAEQEHRHRADKFGAFAFDKAAGEAARLESKQRQRVPQLAIQMQHAVHDVVTDGGKTAVNVRLLPALPAISPCHARPAIQALWGRMGHRSVFAMHRFHRAPQ